MVKILIDGFRISSTVNLILSVACTSTN